MVDQKIIECRQEIAKLREKSAPYVYKNVEATRIIDGDTAQIRICGDVGFHYKYEFQVRIRTIPVDTPERGQDGFKEASDYFGSLILGKPLTVETWKADSFGRWLGRIVLPDGLCTSELMLQAGLADVWRGR